MKNITFLLTLSIIILFSACDKSTGVLKISDLDDHPVYFQFEYINFAWGYSHHGFFIDGEGNVMRYEQPMLDSNIVWTRIVEGDLYSETELKDNYAHATNLLTTVDLKDLLKQVNQIPDINLTNLSEPEGQSFDGGTFTLYAFLWDKEENKYQRILLEARGDIAQKNQSPTAESIVDWLLEVGDDAYEDPWFGW